MIKKQEYDQSADIWSMGILTYELLVGKIPFNIWSENDLQQIVDREINYPTNYVDMSVNSIDFMRRCLMKNPSERIKLE
jgi:aurora kinase